MSKYLKRPQELSWLDRCSKMSHLLLIQGLKGSGKTALLRSWLEEKKVRSKWFTLSNFSSPSSLLGSPDLPLEAALEKALPGLNDYDVVLWDDVHNLDSQAQHFLFYFLRQNHSSTIHVILSDEHIEHSPEVPALKMSGFSKEQSLEYLKMLEVNLSPDQEDSFLQLTNGLPLFIQLWVQDPDNLRRQEITLRGINSSGQEALKTLSFYPGSLTNEDLTALNIDKASVAELQKKLLVTASKDQFEISSSLQDLVLNSLSEQETAKYADKILEIGRAHV